MCIYFAYQTLLAFLMDLDKFPAKLVRLEQQLNLRGLHVFSCLKKEEKILTT